MSEHPTNSSEDGLKDANAKRRGTAPAPVTLLGVRLVDLSAAEIVAAIIDTVKAGDRGIFAYVNIHALNLAHAQPWLRDFFNNATLAYCDGFGVLLGARLAGLSLRHRSTPPDWISSLAGGCAANALRIFLLGGQPGVAEGAAAALLREHPDLQICGVHHGFFDPRQGSAENQELVRTINEQGAHLLLVGMGMPLQEKWLAENWSQLNLNVALPVGALLDYLSGTKRRPPAWMAQHGLEWAGRLYREPRRLWRRYLLGIPHFFYLILKHRLGMAS